MFKLRRGLVFLLAFVLFSGAMPSISFAELADTSEYDKYIEVKKTPEGKIGKNMTISFTLLNDTSSAMEDVKVSLLRKDYYETEEEEDASGNVEDVPIYEFPFEVTSSTYVQKTIGNVPPAQGDKPGRKSGTISAKVRKDLKEGYYPVWLVISSKGREDRWVLVNIWLTTSTSSTEETESQEDIMFVMGENQDTPYGVYPSVMDFSVNLRNSGIKKAYDVRVSMMLSEDITKFPFEISESNYDRNMGDIDADQTVQVPYSMALRDKLKSGYYPIKFSVKYREDKDTDFLKPLELTYYVRVSGNSEDELSADADANQRKKARLIVESYETVPEVIYAGQPFTLHVKMKNASADIPATNIVFTLAPEEKDGSPIFTTENGSNSIPVSSMSPGGSSDISMNLVSIPTAEQKYYTITIKEKYDSPEFKNAGEGDDVKISIPVKQEARLNTGTIDVMPDSIVVGSEANVMFGINNTGKVLLYNVTATFEGDSIQKTDAYVGNIKPGETGNVDTMISGIAPTMDDGKIALLITYEDENGEISEVKKEMTLTVTEPIIEDFGDMEAGNMEEMEMQDTSFWGKYKFYLIGGACLLAVVIGVIVAKKRKAKKEEGMDDEIS